MTVIRPLALLLLLPLLAGCAARGGAGPDATVEVRNEGASEIAVYVIDDDGDRRRLGRVPAGAVATFRLAADLLTQPRVRFLLEPAAGAVSVPAPDEVYVRPGDQVVLVVPPRR